MKALYSHWSAPDGEHCGYRSKEALQRATALSVLMADRFYDCILVTDTEGWEQYFRELDLPWADVRLDLDHLDAHPVIWSQGKIKALDVVGPPVIHLDHDLFLQKPLPDFDRVLMQSWEPVMHHDHYVAMTDFIRKSPQMRPVPEDFYEVNLESRIPNCGIIGVKDREFLDRWTTQSLWWGAQHRQWEFATNAHPECSFFVWPTYVEQVMARNVEIALGGGYIETLLGENPYWPEGCRRTGFTHLLGGAKRGDEPEAVVAAALERRFPDYSF